MSCMALSRVEAFSELGKDILEKDRIRGRVGGGGERARAVHVSAPACKYLLSGQDRFAANQYRLKPLSEVHSFSLFSLRHTSRLADGCMNKHM